MKNFLLVLLISLSSTTLIQSQTKGPRYQPKEYVEITHPEWSKNATIYEVNVRQYTEKELLKPSKITCLV